jgi:hypothetical protein
VQVRRCGQYASSESAVTADGRHGGYEPSNGSGRSIAGDEVRVKMFGSGFSGLELSLMFGVVRSLTYS